MKKILYALIAIILIALIVILCFFSVDKKNPYKETTWGKFKGECETSDIPQEDHGKEFKKCDYSVPTENIPVFEEVSFPFTNKFDSKKSLPLMASAMIDIDNDGIDEVFVGGGILQEDALFSYTNNAFNKSTFSLPPKPKNTTTYGAVSFDLDKDGRTDLILTGDYGVFWYKNTVEGFKQQKINVPFDEKSVPASITIGDVNRDGHADLFVSSYIKLDKMEGQTIFKDINYGGSSLLMINKGDNTFEDATSRMDLSYVHNTFMAILVDIDNDGFLDLVVAHDTGEVRTYKNDNGKKFIMKNNPTTGKYAYPMGIAVGDYNNDGLLDFFFSNTGSSVPTFLARGDLKEEDEFNGDWILLKNKGNFEFTDVAKETKVADYEFSWGAVFEDFNLDGRQDLVVSENYVDFPPHKLFKLPGRFLVQRADGTFSAVEEQAKVINMNYGITPLFSDFNLDGYPDLIFTNISGPMKAHINKGGNANYIAVRLPENADYVGSIVTVTLNDKSQLTDTYIIGEGLSSDQTATITFGLGKHTKVKSVTIKLPNGNSVDLENPKVNAVNKYSLI